MRWWGMIAIWMVIPSIPVGIANDLIWLTLGGWFLLAWMLWWASWQGGQP